MKEMEKERCKPSTYICEERRFESFRDWPYDEDCASNRQKMAEAGFFYCGTNQEPDLAQCFVCLKKLDGWEPEDDPCNYTRNLDLTGKFMRALARANLYVQSPDFECNLTRLVFLPCAEEVGSAHESYKLLFNFPIIVSASSTQLGDEHRRHASYCEFVKIGKKESELTYLEFLQIVKVQVINNMIARHSEMKERLKEEFDKTKRLLKKNKK